MINGIDVLFVVIALILLFVVWHFGEKYAEWSEWDHQRRRQRIRTRMCVSEELEMESYLDGLRLMLRLRKFSNAMMEITGTICEMTKAFDNFGRQLEKLRL